MDWNSLTFGHYTMAEIQRAVKHKNWQQWRRAMKNMSLEQKFTMLCEWVQQNNGSNDAKAQVTNYVNALRRAGLVSCGTKN